jgi:hypothetical protein
MAPAEFHTIWANEQAITGPWLKALHGIRSSTALVHVMPGGVWRILTLSAWPRNGLPQFFGWFGCS